MYKHSENVMQITLSQNAQPFLKYCLQPDEHRFIIYSTHYNQVKVNEKLRPNDGWMNH